MASWQGPAPPQAAPAYYRAQLDRRARVRERVFNILLDEMTESARQLRAAIDRHASRRLARG